ncbi:hypothetical protein D9756_004647 [Leucocoprinus leucothites]|uniref:Mediator of RNA polymerase II transcription subunit 21 n=1 Tax=Leucocoprinus leucothites TaxID=201217 RepID=A0A8H5LKX3_9AGAR|nr:hypothetical protein D9756_004647 [Leucoagaricus leucothites]
MLQELSHMDRITQLQDEIQQILVIMSNTIAYLTTRANFAQVSSEVPITKQRNPEKFDSPEVFEANKRELVTDLIVKAKQIDYLINSLPEPEPEEAQAKRLEVLEEEMKQANEEYAKAVSRASEYFVVLHVVLRVINSFSFSRGNRIEDLHSQVSEVLKLMLSETDADLIVDRVG